MVMLGLPAPLATRERPDYHSCASRHQPKPLSLEQGPLLELFDVEQVIIHYREEADWHHTCQGLPHDGSYLTRGGRSYIPHQPDDLERPYHAVTLGLTYTQNPRYFSRDISQVVESGHVFYAGMKGLEHVSSTTLSQPDTLHLFECVSSQYTSKDVLKVYDVEGMYISCDQQAGLRFHAPPDVGFEAFVSDHEQRALDVQQSVDITSACIQGEACAYKKYDAFVLSHNTEGLATIHQGRVFLDSARVSWWTVAYSFDANMPDYPARGFNMVWMPTVHSLY